MFPFVIPFFLFCIIEIDLFSFLLMDTFCLFCQIHFYQPSSKATKYKFNTHNCCKNIFYHILCISILFSNDFCHIGYRLSLVFPVIWHRKNTYVKTQENYFLLMLSNGAYIIFFHQNSEYNRLQLHFPPPDRRDTPIQLQNDLPDSETRTTENQENENF